MTVRDAVKVTVGLAGKEPEKTFLVNKQMICAQSPYFKKACDDAQGDNTEIEVHLSTHTVMDL